MSHNHRLLRLIALQILLMVTICVVIWRVTDFIDEWLNSGFQMTRGLFHLTGDAALLLQVLIILALGVCAYWVTRQLLQERNK